MVEMGLIFPIMVFFVFTCFQFVLLFLAYLSVMNATRDVARYIAVNPNTIDSANITALKSRLPPNITGSNLTVTITPTCTALVSNKCSNRSSGQPLTVALQYDATSQFFLPHQFGSGSNQITLPTNLPTYTVYWMFEPS